MRQPKHPTYQIGGKTYTQRKLVFGQIRQLAEVIQGVRLPEGTDPVSWVAALGDRLLCAVAVVLIPEGVTTPEELRAKDNAAIAAELEWAIEPEQLLQVVEDFFTCNPASSLAKQMERLKARIGEMVTVLPGTSPGSPPATPFVAERSSGAAPQESASPTPAGE